MKLVDKNLTTNLTQILDLEEAILYLEKRIVLVGMGMY